MVKQVDVSHYWTNEYLCQARFQHLREQFLAVQQLAPTSIAEIGTGPGLLAGLLKQVCAVVATLDFAEDVGPDIVCDVTSIPLADSTFDLVCAFQMLEHIPWDNMPAAVKEMARVCRKNVLFSVPNNDHMKRSLIGLEVSVLGRSLSAHIRKRTFRGVSNPKEHHWEIGVPPVTVLEVREVISCAGLSCQRDWVVGANHYFLCGKAHV